MVSITGIILNQRVVNITGTVVSIIRAGGQDASDYTGGKAFEFNDAAIYVLAIKNGAITKVEVMSDI